MPVCRKHVDSSCLRNGCQYRFDVLQNIIVVESQYANPLLFQPFGAFGIFCSPFVVAVAIQFDCHLLFMAVEVDSERSHRMLSSKLQPAQFPAAQATPEQPFRKRGILSKPAGTGFHVFGELRALFFHVNRPPWFSEDASPAFPHPDPLPEGEGEGWAAFSRFPHPGPLPEGEGEGWVVHREEKKSLETEKVLVIRCCG